MPATYEPIASQTLGTAASTVTFSSIPGTFTDLILVFNGSAVSNTNIHVRFNGDTGTNYSRTVVYGDGTSAVSIRDSSLAQWYGLYGASGGGLNTVHIMSYANTNVFKTALSAGAFPSIAANRTVGLWRSTSAITSITLTGDTANIASGSTFSLYGIKAA